LFAPLCNLHAAPTRKTGACMHMRGWLTSVRMPVLPGLPEYARRNPARGIVPVWENYTQFDGPKTRFL
jgi:hypothetical protein